MIDYLEQFFREQENGLELLAAPAPEGVQIPQEPATVPEPMPVVQEAVPASEVLRIESVSPDSPTKAVANVDIFQHTTIQNLEYTLTNFEQQAGMRPVSRPAAEQAGEDLERRLRRDSRRYDSGFYWY